MPDLFPLYQVAVHLLLQEAGLDLEALFPGEVDLVPSHLGLLFPLQAVVLDPEALCLAESGHVPSRPGVLDPYQELGPDLEACQPVEAGPVPSLPAVLVLDPSGERFVELRLDLLWEVLDLFP